MNARPIQVGFIGLNPNEKWASASHLPALRALKEDFEIVGVANRSYESSVRTKEAFGFKIAFSSTEELINSPEIDLVVVSVKVPHHYQLVSAALNAGKHVYCEWPLGVNAQEATQLRDLANKKGLITAIGTQGRAAPSINYIKKLVESGFVGRVLSTSIIASGGNWADQTTSESYYLSQAKNGATMQAIAVGHALATMQHVTGDLSQLKATFVRNFSEVQVVDTKETLPKDVPDQVMVQGKTKIGAAFSLHYRAGASKGTNLLWEINGTEGDIRISGDMGYPQIVNLIMEGASKDEEKLKSLSFSTDPKLVQLEPAAINVAELYKLLANDIRNGTSTAPNFNDAVKLHELLDLIELSANEENNHTGVQ